MYKLFLIAACIAFAFAQEDAPKTKEQCTAEFAGDCAVCKAPNQLSAECKAARDGDDLEASIFCALLKDCYDDAVEVAAVEKADALDKAYLTYCPTDKARCFDTDTYCPTWAKDGECTKNPDWMLANCANSCCPTCTGASTLKEGICPTEAQKDQCVKNTHSSCYKWANLVPSECTENPQWMVGNCMQSCCDVCKKDANNCPVEKELCKNKYAGGDKKCKDWAKAGECTKNSEWMNSNCAKECCALCAPVAPDRTLPTLPIKLPEVVQPVRQVVQQPVTRVVQQAAQQPVTRVVQQAAQQPVTRVVQQPVRQVVQQAVAQQAVAQQPVAVQQPVQQWYQSVQRAPVAQQVPRFGGYNLYG